MVEVETMVGCVEYIIMYVSFLHSCTISLSIAAIYHPHAIKLVFRAFLDRSKHDGIGNPHLSGPVSPL